MFDGNVTNQFPHSIADCNREDPVAASLWRWARGIRVFSVVLFVLSLVGTGIYAGLMYESMGEGAYAYIPVGILIGIVLLVSLLIVAVLLCAMARIVQNTYVTANSTILKLTAPYTPSVQNAGTTRTENTAAAKQTSGDGHKGNPEIIEKRSSGTAPAPSAHTPAPTVHSFEELNFGKYMQSGTSEKESITWKILHKEGNKALVISKYALDCKPYNDTETGVTWETCSLRNWLNGEFFNSAFSEKEKEKILTTNVTAESNPKYDTPAGNDTEDKVFLLSINQSKEYFESASERSCNATIYSQKQGADTKKGDFCWWWLRSPGDNSNYAAGVNSDGSVNRSGHSINDDSDAVRPAMWIKLD